MRGTVLRSIPWDVWVAAAIAVVLSLVAIFDLTPAILIVVYLLCAYVVAETIGKEVDGP